MSNVPFLSRDRGGASPKELAQLLRTVPDLIDSPVVVLEANRHVLYLNPAWERLTASSSKELLEQPFEACLPASAQQAFAAYWTQLWDEQDAQQIDAATKADPRSSNSQPPHFTSRANRSTAISWTGRLVHTDEGKPYAVLTGRDVTREQQLRRDVLNASEHERRRLGRALHDLLASDLVAVRMQVENVQTYIESGTLELNDLLHRLKLVELEIRDAGQKARSLSHLLASGEIAAEDLPEMLADLVYTQKTLSGIEGHFTPPEAPPSLFITDREARHLFLIAQEAVRNAVTHAAPRRIDVVLSISKRPMNNGTSWPPQECQVLLKVQDDGVGFSGAAPSNDTRRNGAVHRGTSDRRPNGIPSSNGCLPDSASSGIGLQLMTHRASLIGADLTIQSAPGEGTTIRCLFPVSRDGCGAV